MKSITEAVIISAQEAIKISQEAHQENLRREREKINSLITLAAKEGTTELYAGALSNEIIEELKQLGYKVERASNIEKEYFIIWRN